MGRHFVLGSLANRARLALAGRGDRSVAIRLLAFICLAFVLWPLGGLRAEEDPFSTEAVDELVRQAFVPDPTTRRQVLRILENRGRPDVVPGLIQVMRFMRDGEDIDRTLAALTDEAPGKTWPQWALWLQAHPEIEPFEGFDGFKADVMAVIDPEFRRFLDPNVAHEIRLEEILWGGVPKDGIPALINPALIAPAEAGWLTPDELVFGVEIDGDARAYPLRILDCHEMFNDVVGGVPVALAYCTLCGSGILYDARVPGREEPFVFGSSGFLYRSNKLMYDQATHSLWNQFTGRPVVGPLTGSGIELAVLPVAITRWQDWFAAHPDTRVLSLDTGFERDYTPGRPYGEYFASPEPMFPVLVEDERLAPKDYVFALRVEDAIEAWPLSAFEGGRVLNGRAGEVPVVLIGDAASRTVRAYRSEGRAFAPGVGPQMLQADGATWQIEEGALVGPQGERLDRLPGHVAYWFAWQAFIEGAPLAVPGKT
jgi:hypothetical protein